MLLDNSNAVHILQASHRDILGELESTAVAETV